MKQLLKFKKEGLKGLHFFTKNLNYPVVVASYDEWEEQQLAYLKSGFDLKNFTTESLCRWCACHHVQYQIVYPLGMKSIFRNPYKYLKYLQLRRKLNEAM